MFRKMFYITLVLAVAFLCGEAFAQSRNPTPGYRQDPGTGKIIESGGYPWTPPKTFRLVRYVSPDPIALYADWEVMTKDSIVVWHTASPDGVTVTTTLITADSRVAGVLAASARLNEYLRQTAQQDYGRRNWTWLQTYGICNVISGSGDPTTGDALGTYSTAGRADQYGMPIGLVGDSSRADLSPHYGNAGFWMSDPNAAGEYNCKAFIKTE